jgi:predicted HNH restriction endonuclease
MPDFIEIIDQWLDKKRSFRDHRDDIISLFKVAIENTLLPDKSWFGFPPTKTSLSIMFGRIYLIGIFNRTIEIIVDADISKEIGFRTRIVGTSKSSGLNLYWVSTDFEDIKELVANEKIWQHYKLASLKVNSSPSIRSVRQDWLVGKFLVGQIFNGQINEIDQKTLEQTFQRELKLSSNDTKERRQQRLLQATKKPVSTFAQTKVFLRNADVVIEVLERANGHCEYCNKPAPFSKDTDGQGYLEVHHIIPLADNGEDTVNNAVALCANCHRQAHYGKKTFDFDKLKRPTA